MGFFFTRGRLAATAPGARRLAGVALAVSAALLSACTTTGSTFKTAGLNHIVVGRTTIDQASDHLGARPVDVWQQGDTTLARWAYSATAATDAFYFRQEAWLRFGPDGTFQRMENGINVPPTQYPRTAEEADRTAQAAQSVQAAQAAEAAQAAGTPSVQATSAQAGEPAVTAPIVVAPGDTGGITPETVPAASAIQPASMAIPPATAPAQPLLPAGTQVVPGVTYPLGRSGS